MSCCGGCNTIVTGPGGVNPPIDPLDCNGATFGPEGLLAPRTEVTGVAVNAPGTGTPVDVFVTHTPGCPESYQVSAQIPPPVSGMIAYGGRDMSDDPNNTYFTMPGVMTLPEAGCYNLDVTVRHGMEAEPGTSQGALYARLWDATAGVVVPLSELMLESTNRVDTAGRFGGQNSSQIAVRYCVDGPTQIELQARKITFFGSVGLYWIGPSDADGQQPGRFSKVSD